VQLHVAAVTMLIAVLMLMRSMRPVAGDVEGGDEANKDEERALEPAATLNALLRRRRRLRNVRRDKRSLFVEDELVPGSGRHDGLWKRPVGSRQPLSPTPQLRTRATRPAGDGPASAVLDGLAPAVSMADDNKHPPPQSAPEHQVATPVTPHDHPGKAHVDNSDRSQLVSRARAFLTSPQVAHEDVPSKRAFLVAKGLAAPEIEQLLAEVVSLFPLRLVLC
jgi:hypothetical protein